MKEQDGGLAFPFPCSDQGPGEPGMSLRDYAAIQFAAAWIVALSGRHTEAGYDDDSASREANRLALQQADHYLKQREAVATAEIVSLASLPLEFRGYGDRDSIRFNSYGGFNEPLFVRVDDGCDCAEAGLSPAAEATLLTVLNQRAKSTP